MKAKKVYLFLLLSTFIGLNVLNADCEIAKQEGENLLVYIKPATLKDEDTIINLSIPTDNVYVVVTNNFNDSIETFYKDNANNSETISIISPDIYTNIKYEIKAYNTDQTCGTEAIKVYTIETGIYNKFSDLEICWDKLYLDVCKNHYTSEDIEKYYNIEKITEEKLEVIINKEKNEMEKDKKTFLNIIKEYYLYVIIPVFIISVIYITIILIVKRRKKLNENKI